MPTSTRILVVDDDPVICLMLELALKRTGFEVELVHDGVEALEAVSASPPDVVIADIMMPRLDGIALCREIRRNPEWRSIPIVLYSAVERRASELGGEVPGVVTVSKAEGLGTLLSTVRGLIPAGDELVRMLNEQAEAAEPGPAPHAGLPGRVERMREGASRAREAQPRRS
jgi:CheY-like chemotaxis protein